MVTTIKGFPPVDDATLERLSRLNEGWSFERDDDGNVLMAPNHTRSGWRSATALMQLEAWRVSSGAGGDVYDSSTGFKMSTGAVRSPDASWLSQERIDSLSDEERTGFWRVGPDVVIEVRSESNTWGQVVDKIKMYAREGARYAIGIDPFKRCVFEIGEPPAGLKLDIDAIAVA
jgi:Uma2 family endonuclease